MSTENRTLFWCLVVAQAVGSQVIIWTAIPVYRQLLSHDMRGVGTVEIGIVLAAVVIMQAAYWINYGLQPRLEFRRNRVAGHLLQWVGELSYFFPNAFAAVVIFDRLGELEFRPGRVLAFVGVLFAVFCYKKQLDRLGTEICGTEVPAIETAHG